MREAFRQFHEAKRFFDSIFNSPDSGRRWPGFMSVEQIMIRLGLHRRSVYKLIRKHLVPRGAVYRMGQGSASAVRILVAEETFEAYLKDRERRPRRNRLLTSTRWTRSGPRPVPPKPMPPAREDQEPPLSWIPQPSALFWLIPAEEREAIIAKVVADARRRREAKYRAGLGDQATEGPVPETGLEARPPTPDGEKAAGGQVRY